MQTNAILGNLLQNGLQNICCICFTESTEVLYTLDCALEDVSGKTMDFILKQKFAMVSKTAVKKRNSVKDLNLKISSSRT